MYIISIKMLDLIQSIWQDHWLVITIVYVVQGLIGVALLEWSWAKTNRLRNAEPEMIAQFPDWTKPGIEKWQRYKFYPGCFLMLIPRVIYIFIVLFWIGFWQKLLYLGHGY